ncbi:MAG: Lsr2 family protein [Blastococcus sp.]|nr:Lsr2 family protein [Blastococcus sp.]
MVERKTLEDLAGSLTSSRRTNALAELTRCREPPSLSRTATAGCSSSGTRPVPRSPRRSPRPRPASPRCRWGTAKPARWRRSGPTAGWGRAWARARGIEVSDRGRIPADLLRRFYGSAD